LPFGGGSSSYRPTVRHSQRALKILKTVTIIIKKRLVFHRASFAAKEMFVSVKGIAA
jgi:hypothetical protein